MTEMGIDAIYPKAYAEGKGMPLFTAQSRNISAKSSLVIHALRKAFRVAKPLILNSDQG